MKIHATSLSVKGPAKMKNFVSIGLLTTTLVLPSIVRATGSATAELWLDKCARCHGDTGAGDTPLGRKLKVADYSSKKAQEAFTDEYLAKLIVEGKTTNHKIVMPAYNEQITDGEVKNLVGYIRSLAKSG
jgi:mono/diheme cytochrome c family protein